MGKLVPEISDSHRQLIEKQKMFFVGSAPLAKDGHINISPKGLEQLQVLNPKQVAYLDLVGSGNETSAHLLENGRITFMFCSFDKVPCILRLYGTGRVVLPISDEWHIFAPLFPVIMGTRQIIVADIYHVQTSCGYGVPLYDYKGDREILFDWANKKGETGIANYQKEKNQVSLDNLPTHLSLR